MQRKQQEDPDCEVCLQGWEFSQELERLILANMPLWEISERMSTPLPAIHRHVDHVDGLTDQDRLLYQLDVNLSEAIGVKNRARASYAPKLELDALREVRALIDLKARILGEIKTRQEITIVEHPDFQRIRYNIMTALERYPEAKRAVVEELAAVRALPCAIETTS